MGWPGLPALPALRVLPPEFCFLGLRQTCSAWLRVVWATLSRGPAEEELCHLPWRPLTRDHQLRPY